MPVPETLPDVHAVIDARAVTTVYQPLVELDSRRVIGYEALSRGPAGTVWQSPLELFQAARAVGRDAELDWVCRAAAYRGALDAGMDRSTTLFVNMEPAAWRTACPDDLTAVVDAARRRLRVVVEMTERAIAHDPSALLAATARSRTAGWGVALDDVGADPGSLALMPFVHPDVVKLDMHLLHRHRDPQTALVVGAVAAYAEGSGATVLAEGIETEQHVAIARSMGATLGQGWHFGRPGPLPPGGPRPARPLRLLGTSDRPAGTASPTPFSIVAARRPVRRATKSLLMPISRYLESQAGSGLQPSVLLACFQDARHFTPATARRFAGFARHNPLVAALAVGLADEPVPGVRGADLRPGDPLGGEWNVVVVGPHHAAALVARDLDDDGPDAQRTFDYVVTYDRPLVVDAARALLRWLSPVHPAAPARDPAAGAAHLINAR
jgi:EAL domain-containing protein (putative c-di-GMP-specific phosphodiesterase class I)